MKGKKKSTQREKRASLSKEVSHLLLIFGLALSALGVGLIWRSIEERREEGVQLPLFLREPGSLVDLEGLGKLSPAQLERSWALTCGSYLPLGHKGGEPLPITADAYSQFCHYLSDAMTLPADSKEMANKLNARFRSTDRLFLFVTPLGEMAQEIEGERQLLVEFARSGGDLWRCSIQNEEGEEQEWLYFHTKGIQREAQRLFLRGER